ncbi:5-(carboxyamino)imidazole ribonucleotide synthase [Alkalibacter rhizosphaerae]|uniref:N5-carboxyaminoimidazole ribonucleotide synthase n=1 Tax=Alkalibacter rhizosphaerae TaxID=2815577 RepID=A0A974XHH2_9FIRM|nr:5-(carboxyamino)imidazole ribonucleotide synthase [Alkalibacter rhizosphaerae]QSX08448.1 5-(carboxyamino)imidazole ribonucleotide synthase [Alkalibacter rhizosphaerae]
MNKNILKQRLGIIGGGQLGKMMLQASSTWSISTVVLDPDSSCPASAFCDELIVAGFQDEKGLESIAKKSDVLTCEFEHISTEGLKNLERKGYIVYPRAESLKIIQNKYDQKKFLKEKGLPVGTFLSVNNSDQLHQIGEELGYPYMLKTATEAYDGKGNQLVSSFEQAPEAYEFLSKRSDIVYAEAFIDFDREISVLCCRGKDGKTVTYPVAENIHKNSILYETLAPARITNSQESEAKEVAVKISGVFDAVGIFCVEMFIDKKGSILINEVAPRPHNSGHFTIEACETSQFENHVRAVLGLPLGSTRQRSPVVMRNLLGTPDHAGIPVIVGAEKALSIEGFHLHYYGKEQTRPHRKMGHFTVLADTLESAIEKADLGEVCLRIVSESSKGKE